MGKGMRYIAIEWIGKKPNEREIFAHLRRVLGEVGTAQAKVGFTNGLIACDRKWVEKVRGALALRWQFKVKKISGTMRKAMKE